MKYLFMLALLVSIPASAQFRLPTNELGQVQYQEIVKVPNAKLPAKQMMGQFHEWAEKYYAAGGSAEQQYDPEHNIMFIKSLYRINGQTIRYSLTAEAKFGRYRATITDLVAENNGFNTPILGASSTVEEMEQAAGGKTTNRKVIEQTAQQQADLYRQIDRACRDTLANLKSALMSHI
ncbi:hypothetical protein GCM10028805_57340 [Spirosoma harenae]